HNGALLPTRTGLNLFVSNSVYTDAIVPEYHADWLEPYAGDTLAARGIAVTEPGGPVVEREKDRMVTRIALETMTSDPLTNIARRFRYVAYFFSPFLVPQRIATVSPSVTLGERGQVLIDGTTLRPLRDRLVYTLSFVPILLLAIVGAWTRRAS